MPVASTVRSYRDLRVWQAGYALTLRCYALTKELPKTERFGLASQIRRAAASVPANIAEGNGRLHRGDYVRHLSIADGSLAELKTHIRLAVRRGQVSDVHCARAFDLAERVSQLLGALQRSLRLP
jgi:four helix bundle protein